MPGDLLDARDLIAAVTSSCEISESKYSFDWRSKSKLRCLSF